MTIHNGRPAWPNHEIPEHPEPYPYVFMGFELARATEAAALAAGRYVGLGLPQQADEEASTSLLKELGWLPCQGYVIGHGHREREVQNPDNPELWVGTGSGPEMDVVYAAVDGTNLLAQGRPGAVSVICATPRDQMWLPRSALNMQKIVVDRRVAKALVPECLDAPPGWVLALVARELDKDISDLVVWVLDRPRHTNLVSQIRLAGARAQIRIDGDIAGALLAGNPDSRVDVLMGVGGAVEGLLAAAGVKAMGGAMVTRLAPRDEEERRMVLDEGHDLQTIQALDDLVKTNDIYFAATGITDGELIRGVTFTGRLAKTHSLILGEGGVKRFVQSEHPMRGGRSIAMQDSHTVRAADPETVSVPRL